MISFYIIQNWQRVSKMISYHLDPEGHPVEDFIYAKPTVSIITKHVWSNILWAAGIRAENNFIASYYCTLDFDESITKDEARESLKGFQYLLGPTKSDGVDKVSKTGSVKPACDRFRVIVKWEKPINDLDVYRYNAGLMIKKYDADPQGFDGARIWQPCKCVETVVREGAFFPVDEDVPLDQTKAAIKEKFEKQTEFFRRTHTWPRYVHDFMEGRFKSGEINKYLFKFSCLLFNSGWTIKEVTRLMLDLPAIRYREDLHTTIRSAARRTGASE